MASIIFLVIMTVHGLIHLMGFAKAYQLAEMKELTLPISKPVGLIWLVTAGLLILSAVLFLINKEAWWIVAVAAVVVSQILIIAYWKDAKFGMIANVIILIAAIVGYATWHFYNIYQSDVKAGLARASAVEHGVLTAADIQRLPAPVQKYLIFAGVVGKEKVTHFKSVFDGQLRQENGPWFDFQSEQYNFIDVPTRLFFIKAVMKGMPVAGYHAYKNGSAMMLIKAFSIIPIIDAEGEEMNIGETVTVLNDMCVMAPASLIDDRIRWEEIDDFSTKAIFTNNGITISALLYFNEIGQLINFISDDRCALSGKSFKKLRWSTPISEYTTINGFNLPARAETVYQYPEGEFSYGKFVLKDVQYNCPE